MTGLGAGRGGSVEVLEYLWEENYEFDERACSGAAKEGHLKALKFLRGLDPPCPLNERTCSFAAENGRLDVLKFLRSQDPPCPWDGGSCATAAWKGYLEVLKWLRDQDPPCPWRRSICIDIALGYRQQHIVDWIDQQEDESDEEKYRDWGSMEFSYSENEY